MKVFVYVLRSNKDNSNYVGISRDPNKRLVEHNSGYSKYTRGHRPFELIYREEFVDRVSARHQEKYLKSGTGRDFINKLFPLSSVGRARDC
ncbi:MAG: GIY-YIG nuclease family protein [Candidatus Omnitrophica bacterium]|nr:GIY-YIG nuclease family protein [Candidatus Omnitrophota bacterium]